MLDREPQIAKAREKIAPFIRARDVGRRLICIAGGNSDDRPELIFERLQQLEIPNWAGILPYKGLVRSIQRFDREGLQQEANNLVGEIDRISSEQQTPICLWKLLFQSDVDFKYKGDFYEDFLQHFIKKMNSSPINNNKLIITFIIFIARERKHELQVYDCPAGKIYKELFDKLEFDSDEVFLLSPTEPIMKGHIRNLASDLERTGQLKAGIARRLEMFAGDIDDKGVSMEKIQSKLVAFFDAMAERAEFNS